MVTHEPARAAARRTRSRLGWALVLVVMTLLGVVTHASLAVEDAGEAGLDPSLLDAFRLASSDAAGQGIELVVNSGWRSPEEQERLLAEAVARYGSRDEAARWVATPETSPHVSGDAIDIGPAEGATWLSTYGAAYGLCQIYGNEPWHFELRPDAVHHGCPPMYADPTQDPRMQR